MHYVLAANVRGKTVEHTKGEIVVVLKEIDNLGRRMYLIRFYDGETTFVFPNELDNVAD